MKKAAPLRRKTLDSSKNIYPTISTTRKVTTSRQERPQSTARPQTARPQMANNPVMPVLRGPISPKEAVDKYSAILTPAERDEIFQYSEIYYLGKFSIKTNPKGLPSGYDTSLHHYKAKIGDHIIFRYEIRSLLGKGAFGQVLRCFDHKTQKQVAVKIIISTPQMIKQGQREISILQKLVSPNENNYIIQLLDNFTFRNHLCAVFEVLGQNLYDYAKSMRFRPMPMAQVQTIAREMLTALDFAHSHGIVHCDLKPENILFTSGPSKDIQIIDFGSSCFIGDSHFDYIQSRYYRSPEVILGLPYGPPMDIWSFAGIVVELLTGKPLFPGSNETEQISRYVQYLGLPPKEMLRFGNMSIKYFTESGLLRPIKGQKRVLPKSVTIPDLTNIKNPLLIDLLTKCLTWDQNERITAHEALNHPWLTKPVQKSTR